uniref:Uncharacterized protein n=1 Tax=Quercus lobata TaxID=97700 RepID=A0A7N2RET2_QUELO
MPLRYTVRYFHYSHCLHSSNPQLTELVQALLTAKENNLTNIIAMAIVEKQVMVVGIDDKEHSTFALDWTLKQFFTPFASNPIFRLVIVQAKPSPSVFKPGELCVERIRNTVCIVYLLA